MFSWTTNREHPPKTDVATGQATYDAFGRLREVVLPNGDVLESLVDGLGRRVGKKVNGVLEKQWLWRSQLQPVAELDGLGNVTKRFVYAGGVNVPDLVVTQTATYRLIKDHLGSARTVVDIASGAIVQELEYDSWGRVLVDDSFDAQPFRFAGGTTQIPACFGLGRGTTTPRRAGGPARIPFGSRRVAVCVKELSAPTTRPA